MKKVLALILAFAMVFSTISFVFAEEEVVEAVEEVVEAVVSDEAAALSTIGMLEGSGDGVTAEYEAKELERLTAAIMILKLRGLYEESLEYDGVNNFADAEDLKWDGGKKVLAYVKDNPVGFGGNEKGEFMPYATLSEQMFYKVLLENLGYKQTTDEVVGDFAWDGTIEFAESIGLKPAKAEKFTVGGLAKAVVAALKLNTKDGKPWIEVLVDAEKVDLAKAIAAGLMEEAPSVVAVEVKEAKAIGNTVVEVKFKEAVGEEAENVEGYAIDGLEVKGAALAGAKVVRLETEAMKSGKVYKLVVGEKTVQFTGIAKVSGGPDIDKVESEDVEEIIVTFNKNIDLEAGADVENYAISGVEIVKADVDGKEVTLTTEGLKNKTKYTLKVTNMKSVDGASKKSSSKSFTSKYDLVAPKIDGVGTKAKTNQKIALKFSEKVTQESAEDIDNYGLKLNKTDGEELEIISVTWDDDDEDNVTIVTEAMEKNKEYKLTVNNIADQRKVANVMTRAATFTFKGLAEDTKGPTWNTITVLSPTAILVEFKDDSDIDEDSALDLNNYELKDLDIESIETVKNDYQVFRGLLTVEEMDLNKGYELKIADVLDEFGNEMKETKKTARATSDNVAAAKLTAKTATGKNTVKLTFDKELVKSTAEDIANYEITKGIGAPTKAKYDKDSRIVTLTVNDLVNGYAKYDIVVDGVEDLAGNVLYYKDKIKNDVKWESDAPELESVEILNKFVVALTFDEKVSPDENAKLHLYELENELYKDANKVLEYKDLVDDDTVVEFYITGGLEDGKVYAVWKVVYGAEDGGIKDLIGNPFLEGDIDTADFEFTGIDEGYEAAEFETYEQIDGKTFEVTFSKNIEKDLTVTFDITEGLVFKVDDVDGHVVTLRADKAIKEDDEYVFNFAAKLKDKFGVAVKNDDTLNTTLTGEFTDDEEPWIDDVVAKNRETVKVVFDEELGTSVFTGFFTLRNYDLDKPVGIKSYKLNEDKDVLEIELDKPLEARYEYELKFVKGKVIEDLVGNKLVGDDDTYYFYGTNLAK